MGGVISLRILRICSVGLHVSFFVLLLMPLRSSVWFPRILALDLIAFFAVGFVYNLRCAKCYSILSSAEKSPGLIIPRELKKLRAAKKSHESPEEFPLCLRELYNWIGLFPFFLLSIFLPLLIFSSRFSWETIIRDLGEKRTVPISHESKGLKTICVRRYGFENRPVRNTGFECPTKRIPENRFVHCLLLKGRGNVRRREDWKSCLPNPCLRVRIFGIKTVSDQGLSKSSVSDL